MDRSTHTHNTHGANTYNFILCLFFESADKARERATKSNRIVNRVRHSICEYLKIRENEGLSIYSLSLCRSLSFSLALSLPDGMNFDCWQRPIAAKSQSRWRDEESKKRYNSLLWLYIVVVNVFGNGWYLSQSPVTKSLRNEKRREKMFEQVDRYTDSFRAKRMNDSICWPYYHLSRLLSLPLPPTIVFLPHLDVLSQCLSNVMCVHGS